MNMTMKSMATSRASPADPPVVVSPSAASPKAKATPSHTRQLSEIGLGGADSISPGDDTIAKTAHLSEHGGAYHTATEDAGDGGYFP